ncbi:MAG: lipopolysaccharide heptosyltransferase II [Acidobacteriota bacterium]
MTVDATTPGVNGRACKSLLVRAPNWLGDAVMALPALGALRAAFADAQITVAATSSVAPLFEEDTPAAPDDVIAITRGGHEAAALRSGGYDAALLLPNSFRAAWTVRSAGIAERWGYSANLRSRLLTRAIPRPAARHLHQSAYYNALVRGLGIEVSDVPPRLSIRPETAERAAALLARQGITGSTPIVGFAPGAAYGHAKRWPPRRVADVVTRVTRERGAVCLLVGARADGDAGREIESSLPADVRPVNLIGRTDLRLLIGLLGRCSAFVSNDSGAMHLAAAIGVPVAALFGPTDDRVTAPLGDHDVLIHQVFCRPCMLRECPIDHRCMKGISVEAVFAAVTRRLTGAS